MTSPETTIGALERTGTEKNPVAFAHLRPKPGTPTNPLHRATTASEGSMSFPETTIGPLERTGTEKNPVAFPIFVPLNSRRRRQGARYGRHR